MNMNQGHAGRLAFLRRPRTWLLLGIMLVVIVAISMFRGKRENLAATTYEVRRGTFTVSIVEAGNLAAVNEVSIRSEVEGTARIIYIVPEGSYVKKDDLLVELDSAAAQDQVNQQQINYEKARFALIQSQEQLAIQSNTVASDISAGELKLNFARLDLEKYEQGQRIVDQIEASNKVVQAESQLAVNLETYRWTTNLAAKGYETQQKVDADRLAVLNNRNSLIVASNSIWLLNQFDIPKQRQQFESDVLEASNELRRVQAQSRAKIAQAVADLLTQSNTLALSRRKLERDQNNLKATKIYAPQDGLVVYSVSENRFSSESLIEEGATIRNRQEIIKLPDTSRMKVTVKVHESHVNMVRPGLPAYVVLESMPDQHFAAVVHRVALLPDTQSRWGNPNLKVYNTDIYITDLLPDVKPGVSAMAEIVITNIENALSVPIQAVTTLGNKQVVYLAGNPPKPAPVELGMYNTKFIQITRGVEEGDRVLLAPPFDTQEKNLKSRERSSRESETNGTNAPSPARPPVSPGGPGRDMEPSTSLPTAPGSRVIAAVPSGENARVPSDGAMQQSTVSDGRIEETRPGRMDRERPGGGMNGESAEAGRGNSSERRRRPRPDGEQTTPAATDPGGSRVTTDAGGTGG